MAEYRCYSRLALCSHSSSFIEELEKYNIGTMCLTASQMKALVVAKEMATKEKEDNKKVKANQREQNKKALQIKRIDNDAAREAKKALCEAQAAQRARDKLQRDLVKRSRKRRVLFDGAKCFSVVEVV